MSISDKALQRHLRALQPGSTRKKQRQAAKQLCEASHTFSDDDNSAFKALAARMVAAALAERDCFAGLAQMLDDEDDSYNALRLLAIMSGNREVGNHIAAKHPDVAGVLVFMLDQAPLRDNATRALAMLSRSPTFCRQAAAQGAIEKLVLWLRRSSDVEYCMEASRALDVLTDCSYNRSKQAADAGILRGLARLSQSDNTEAQDLAMVQMFLVLRNLNSSQLPKRQRDLVQHTAVRIMQRGGSREVLNAALVVLAGLIFIREAPMAVAMMDAGLLLPIIALADEAQDLLAAEYLRAVEHSADGLLAMMLPLASVKVLKEAAEAGGYRVAKSLLQSAISSDAHQAERYITMAFMCQAGPENAQAAVRDGFLTPMLEKAAPDPDGTHDLTTLLLPGLAHMLVHAGTAPLLEQALQQGLSQLLVKALADGRQRLQASALAILNAIMLADGLAAEVKLQACIDVMEPWTDLCTCCNSDAMAAALSALSNFILIMPVCARVWGKARDTWQVLAELRADTALLAAVARLCSILVAAEELLAAAEGGSSSGVSAQLLQQFQMVALEPPPPVGEAGLAAGTAVAYEVSSACTVDSWVMADCDDLVDLYSCARCGAQEQEDGRELMRCSRCRGVAYCSASCQKEHWKVHKKRCSRVH